MRRLNKDGKEFQRGDIREDGYIFWTYRRKTTKGGFCIEDWCHPSRYYQQFNSRRLTEQKNRGVCVARAAKRRAAILQATPPWIEPYIPQIQEIYKLCQIAQDVFNEEFHVDHIEPLQGDDVCGLHVPWNLTILPWLDNIKKGNRRVETNGFTSLSIRLSVQSKINPQLGFVFTTGTGEDCDDANDNRGAVQRKNTNYRSKKGSGNSVEHGAIEVVTPVQLDLFEDNGDAEPEIIRLYFGS